MGLLQLLYTFPTDHNLIWSAPFQSPSHRSQVVPPPHNLLSFFRIVVLINLHFLQLATAELHSFGQTKGPLRRCIVLEKGLWC